jgi:hypothetical protein
VSIPITFEKVKAIRPVITIMLAKTDNMARALSG